MNWSGNPLINDVYLSRQKGPPHLTKNLAMSPAKNSYPVRGYKAFILFRKRNPFDLPRGSDTKGHSEQ